MSSLLQIAEPGHQDRQESQGPAIGIDLGTTHSLVAMVQDGSPVIFPSHSGESLLPSIVSFLDEAPKVGKIAAQDIAKDSSQVILSSKRLMGKAEAEGKITSFQVGHKNVTPIEVAAEILKTLKKQAEMHLGEVVHQAVITVPAYFDEAARAATRDAARLAGLQVLRLLNEPTAAALAYGLDVRQEGKYAVYDLGGGTFDISILRLERGIFQVLATCGHTQLGGDDFDNVLAQELFQSDSKSDLTKARHIKEHLTLEDQLETSSGKTITRSELNKLIKPFVDQTIETCQKAIQDADIELTELNGIVLVGGSTRVPYVKQRVAEFFGQDPLTTIDPDCAVAYGAALQAYALTQGSETVLLDVTPLSLGLETMGGLVEKIIHRNTPIPVSKSQEFTTYQDGQTAISIHVVQGERELVDDNRSLARFELRDLPPKIAGAVRVKVTFTIDADGLLTVTAFEATTGAEQTIDIKPSSGLTEEELMKMLKVSYEHAQEDLSTRLIQEAIVKAERLIHAVETALREDQDLLTTEKVLEIKSNTEALRENIALQDRDAITHSYENLEAAVQVFAEKRMNKALKLALTGQDLESLGV